MQELEQNQSIQGFYKNCGKITVAISAVLAIFYMAYQVLMRLFAGYTDVSDTIGISWFIGVLFCLPMALTIDNFIFVFLRSKTRKEENIVKKFETILISFGTILTLLYIGITQIRFSDWNEQLENAQLHSPIWTQVGPTIFVVLLLSLIGYGFLRYMPIHKQPPLTTVLCIAAMYLGAVECVVWCIQLWKHMDWLMCLLPINLLFVFVRTIRDAICERRETQQPQKESRKLGKLSKLLNQSAHWPWLAFLAALPLLGILLAVLTLFGQQPDSFIKAWSQTADWTFSQKVPPPNVIRDEHYLCTVAAGGHRWVVKPLRLGKRHGHVVVVNRQLCIANAFEQLLEERLPRFHRTVRGFYDRTGYPIARHIHSRCAADGTYFLMKPLELLFLSVLYLFDAKPENRIAVQYPHTGLPKENPVK